MSRPRPRFLKEREPTEQQLELQKRIQRARHNTWVVVIAGILAVVGGAVAILTSLVALGAPLLVTGLVAGVLGERRLARLSVAERRVRTWDGLGGPKRLGLPLAWGWLGIGEDEFLGGGGGGADFGGDGGSDP